MSEDTLKAPITAAITSLSINISAFVQYSLSDGLSVVDQLVVIMVSFRIGLLYLTRGSAKKKNRPRVVFFFIDHGG